MLQAAHAGLQGAPSPAGADDPGPAAEPGYYEKDWEQRARWWLPRVFQRMSMQELRALVDWLETEHDFVAAQYALRVRRRIDGETEWVELENVADGRTLAATRITNMLLTGHPNGRQTECATNHQLLNGAGCSRTASRRLCDAAVRSVSEEELSLCYQSVPRSTDHLKLMWHLWLYPTRRADRSWEDQQVLLGTRRLELTAAQPPRQTLGWKPFWIGLNRNQAFLQNQADHMPWLERLQRLSAAHALRLGARTSGDGRGVIIGVYQPFTSARNSKTVSRACGTWKPNGEAEEVSVDVAALLRALGDAAGGAAARQAVDRMDQELEHMRERLAAAGLEAQLPGPPSPQQFEQVLVVAAATAAEGHAGNAPPLPNMPVLQLLSLLLRGAVARALQEERAPGGTARKLWTKWALPDSDDVECFVSPALNQSLACTSRLEAQQLMSACGAAGWIALKEGKAAAAAALLQLNPPPAGWRQQQPWLSLRKKDHLASVLNNAPHGGTLIVAHAAAVTEWYDGLRVAAPGLRVLRWEGEGRSLDCRELATYDAVVTSYKLAAEQHTLCHIRWWRILADWHPRGARVFLGDSQHPWFASHRWVLCGAAAKDIWEAVPASATFLRLARCDVLLKHFPVHLAHVLKCMLVRAAD
ncbi:hypothetical protein ABPG75_003414 [Micractinium tetrahymenae]